LTWVVSHLALVSHEASGLRFNPHWVQIVSWGYARERKPEFYPTHVEEEVLCTVTRESSQGEAPDAPVIKKEKRTFTDLICWKYFIWLIGWIGESHPHTHTHTHTHIYILNYKISIWLFWPTSIVEMSSILELFFSQKGMKQL
jgi:hypothetical protein